MAPSSFSSQPGWRRDQVFIKLADNATFSPGEENKLEQTRQGRANNERSCNGKGASHTQRKNNNVFAGIAEFVAGIANSNKRDRASSSSSGRSTANRSEATASPATTPLTTRNYSSGDEIVIDEVELDNRWGEDSDVCMAHPPAESSAPARGMGANANHASRRVAQQQQQQRQAGASCRGREGRKGKGAGEPEDQGGGEMGRGGGEAGEEIHSWKRPCGDSKRTSFTEERFVPCYATFTPHMSSEFFQEMKYKAPQARVSSAVAPPSSVARPNYHDALRRVAVVVYQHIKTCEWRREAAEEREKDMVPQAQRSPASMQGWPRSAPSLVALRRDHSALWGEGGREGAMHRRGAETVGMNASAEFNAQQADVFHEKHFVSPTFRYKFVQAPVMALPGAVFTLKEVRATPKPPTVDEIYEYIKTLFNKACLSSECSLVCLIYVERLMETAHVPLLAGTWKPILLCGLLLASKVWQDLSSWNVEFSTVYPEYSLKSINRLELLFLGAIRWDMSISSSLYAKYYFALRSLAEKKDFRRRYNQVMQIDAPQATRVQERADAAKRNVIHTQSASMLSKSL